MKSLEQLSSYTPTEESTSLPSQEIQEAGARRKREPFDFLSHNERIHQFMEYAEVPDELQIRISDLLTQAQIDYDRLQSIGSQEEFTEELIALASTRAGLEELRNEILSSQDQNITNVQKGVLVSLLQSVLLRMEMLPLPKMEMTPEEGAKQLQEVIKKQADQPYLRLVAGAGEKARQKVEQLVQSTLERFAGKIPSHERDKVIQAASKLSGEVAFGVTVFGLGLLALGTGVYIDQMAGQEEAEGEGRMEGFGGVDVTKNYANNTLEIKSESTGETILVVPVDLLYAYKPGTSENELYNRLTEYDNEVPGVEYRLTNPEKFEATIISDAQELSHELFQKELNTLAPPEFIKLINAMVQSRIEYDSLVLEEDADGWPTDEAAAEDDKISSMPLDEMYNDYGKGVCRHYAALVEQVGEVLVDKGLVPQCRGMTIDEVISYEMSHAWNIYYINPKSESKTVVIAYTDATYDDTDWSGKFFDNLEARNERHLSIQSSVVGDKLFTTAELKEIYENLTQLDLGYWEDMAAHRDLAGLYLDEYKHTFLANDNELTDEAKKVLTLVMEHARLSGMGDYGFVVNKERYLAAADYRIDALVKQGELGEAISQADEIVWWLREDNDVIFKYKKKVSDLLALAGRMDDAEENYRYMINLFQPINADKWYDSYKELANFYIKHEMPDKLASALNDWRLQLGSDYGTIPVLQLMYEHELHNTHNQEKAQEYLKKFVEAANEFLSLDKEQQEKIPYSSKIIDAIRDVHGIYGVPIEKLAEDN